MVIDFGKSLLGTLMASSIWEPYIAPGWVSATSWPPNSKRPLAITGISKLFHNQVVGNFEPVPSTAAKWQFLHLTRLTFRSYSSP